MSSGLGAKVWNNGFRLIYSTASLITARRYSTQIPPLCDCEISVDGVQECIKQRKILDLKIQMKSCISSEKFQVKWDSYHVGSAPRSGSTVCKARDVFENTLSIELLNKKNVKLMDPRSGFFESHLSVFSSVAGEINLSGEGGKVVGRKEYWDSILAHLQRHKHLSVCVLSVGGALGYDALAIAEVLKRDGFNVQKPIIIDPNLLAAFLSNDDVDYYATTSQLFFENHFSRQGGVLYVIHLGTTLNVVNENDVVQILQQIAQKIDSTDALSLIMVDKKQFLPVKHLSFGAENEQGISRIVYVKTNQHYKTVITDKDKFLRFMSGLDLVGDIIEIVEKGKSLSVAFVAYKAIKKD
jgi:hypothetical protein